jgi:hypothetical protein
MARDPGTPTPPEREDPMSRAVLLLVLLACGACQNPRSWSYAPEAPRTRVAVLDRSVAVLPALDQRDDDNSDSAALYLVPLMPWGWQDFSRPETANRHMTSTMWQFRPDEDIAKAVAAELQGSGLFREAFFTMRPSEGELTMTVTVKRLAYDGKLISYGLSVFGPILWWILPAGTANNEMQLAFELKDRASGNTLWSGAGQRSYESGPFWIYSMPSDFEYDNLLKSIVLQDLLPALERLKTAP